MGQLKDNYSDEMKKRFLDENITEDSINSIAEKFIDSVKNGTCKESGFPENSYKVSKCLVNSWTRMLAREYKDDIFVAAVHPGWIKTRMGGPDAPLTVEDGAETPIYLATESFEKLIKNNGKFWHKKSIEDF